MKIVKPGPPLTEDDLSAFEAEIEGRLPDDYKRFLLTQNGGFPKPPVEIEHRGQLSELGKFMKLLPDVSTGFRRVHNDLRKVLPNQLPIADTYDLHLICIAIRGPVGTISLAELAYDDEGIETGAQVHLIANSFSEFVRSLSEIHKPIDPIAELGRKGTVATLERFLKEGHSIDEMGGNRLTILCEAVKNGNVEMMNACMERGASRRNALHIAVLNHRTTMIEALVSAGADINEQDNDGCTPIFYAGGTALPGEEGAKNRELVNLLIKLGAVVDDLEEL
jgi:SMI1/KNR4 family protein SUKH-1/ankyrin repeat protein